jgi:hypothetical protein
MGMLPVQNATLMRRFESIPNSGQRFTFARRFLERRVNTNLPFRIAMKRSDNIQAVLPKPESMIDTLAAAYAETGDFDSAAQYAAQALAIKGISAHDEKVFREHLALFQQRKRIPVTQ